MGGTFDPPHLGHRALALAAIEQLNLDELIIVPAGRNPLKSRRPAASRNQRFEMARLAFRDVDKVSTSDLEITRSGPSYAIDTLNELRAARPGDYWFVLGADAVTTIENWKQPDHLVKSCRLALALRAPMTRDEILRKVPARFHPFFDWVELPPVAISSTSIRLEAQRRRPIERWVEPAVADYIERNKLYGD